MGLHLGPPGHLCPLKHLPPMPLRAASGSQCPVRDFGPLRHLCPLRHLGHLCHFGPRVAASAQSGTSANNKSKVMMWSFLRRPSSGNSHYSHNVYCVSDGNDWSGLPPKSWKSEHALSSTTSSAVQATHHRNLTLLKQELAMVWASRASIRSNEKSTMYLRWTGREPCQMPMTYLKCCRSRSSSAPSFSTWEGLVGTPIRRNCIWHCGDQVCDL